MPRTLKQNMDSLLGERGFVIPTAYATSTNPADLQMLYMANNAAMEIREAGYQRLRGQATIAMTGATSYTLPSDFLEYVPDTAFVDGRLDGVDFPTNTYTWAVIKAGGPNAYYLRVRVIGGELEIANPINGETFEFEYISNAPIESSGAVRKERFTADDDVWLLDDHLLVMETRWRWEKAKGFGDWQATLAEAKAYANQVRGRDAGAKTIRPHARDIPPTGEPYTNLWVS